ncbi:hypothetical protein MNBD_NITROSPINAE02-83 [hydrothermal vent metagenome]|uniref:Peptidase M48 domain-containing protein n=1 Tax=hydrothermal vent metagenome TaxID=652676 RepID=A0A3B1BCT5_9ZZZZ
MGLFRVLLFITGVLVFCLAGLNGCKTLGSKTVSSKTVGAGFDALSSSRDDENEKPKEPAIVKPEKAPKGKELIIDIQRLLVEHGYNPGPVDGIAGRKTALAVRAYQKAESLEVNGKISEDLWFSFGKKVDESPESVEPPFVDYDSPWLRRAKTVVLMHEYEEKLTLEDYSCSNMVEPFNITDSLLDRIKEFFQKLFKAVKKLVFEGSGEPEKEALAQWKTSMKRVNWIPMNREVEYGEYLHKEIEKGPNKSIPRDSEDWLESYEKADNILRRVLEKVEGEHPYEFKLFLVNSSENNASALPGGYLYVSEGVLDSDHAELVIAHEVAHVLKRHQTMEFQAVIIDSVDTIMDLNKLKDLSPAIMTSQARSMIATGAAILNYSKNQELQSDACGTRVVSDIQKRSIFKKIDSFIEALAEQEEMAGSKSKWFSSHPSYPEREERMKQVANKSTSDKKKLDGGNTLDKR